MFRFRCVLIGSGAMLAMVPAAFAQPAIVPGVDGFDQPCSAADHPSMYRQVSRFVPDEAAAAKRAKIRGVVARSFLWAPGETLKICFRSGSPKARARGAGRQRMDEVRRISSSTSAMARNCARAKAVKPSRSTS